MRGTTVTVTDGASSDDQPRRVLLAVHTGRRDILELARSSAARLARGGIAVRVLEDEAEALAIDDAEVVAPGERAADGTAALRVRVLRR